MPVFNSAANWVCQRQESMMQPAAPAGEVAETLCALDGLAQKCQAAIMIPDLFPGSTLETIVIPAASSDNLSPTSSKMLLQEAQVTVSALWAIGSALTAELKSTGNDMVRYEFDSGAEAIVYLPHVRSIVLQATDLVLLTD